MAKVCPNCKTENSDEAGFCQNCGKKLNEPVKDSPKNKEPHGGIGGWWNKQSIGIKVIIGFVGIFIIGLILIVAISGMDKTFQGNGVSFNYPNTWSVYTPENNTLVNLKRMEPSTAIVHVFKSSADGRSLNEVLEMRKGAVDSLDGYEVVRTKSVTIDGSPGYQITFHYAKDGVVYIFEDVFFIKNDSIYSMIFRGSDVASMESDIKTIVNSFKVE